MKILLFVCLLSLTHAFFPETTYAQSKADALKAIEMLKQSGQFSNADIEEAKKQLSNLDDKEYKKLQKDALLRSKDPTFKANVLKMYQDKQNKLKQKD